jgi:hypothetical protein
MLSIITTSGACLSFMWCLYELTANDRESEQLYKEATSELKEGSSYIYLHQLKPNEYYTSIQLLEGSGKLIETLEATNISFLNVDQCWFNPSQKVGYSEPSHSLKDVNSYVYRKYQRYFGTVSPKKNAFIRESLPVKELAFYGKYKNNVFYAIYSSDKIKKVANCVMKRNVMFSFTLGTILGIISIISNFR